MTLKRFFLLPLLAISPLVFAPAQAAEEGTVQASIPWDGEGKIYQVNTTTIAFLGSLKGIIYVESATGEMNEGFVVCPVMQQLDLESKLTQAVGHCEITASPDDVLYAKMTCEGKLGSQQEMQRRGPRGRGYPLEIRRDTPAGIRQKACAITTYTFRGRSD